MTTLVSVVEFKITEALAILEALKSRLALDGDEQGMQMLDNVADGLQRAVYYLDFPD